MQIPKKLEKLNKLIALVQNDTLKPSDFESLEKIRESKWIKKN